MDDDRLIAETHDMLKRLMDLEAERKAVADRTRAEFEERVAQRQMGQSPTPHEPDGSQAVTAAHQRLEEIQRKNEARAEEARQLEMQYRSDLLHELATQSELLRRIAEKLGV